MRWIAFSLALSLSSVVLISCKTSEPKSQETAQGEKKTTPIDKTDQEAVQAAAERFRMAFIAQDFDTMWSMTDPESKKRTGMVAFIKQLNYAERGSVLDSKIAGVEGLGPGKAIAKLVIDFQWAPSVFGAEFPETAKMEWSDEWIRQPDGQWLRKIPEIDEKARKEGEEICQNAYKGLPTE